MTNQKLLKLKFQVIMILGACLAALSVYLLFYLNSAHVEESEFDLPSLSEYVNSAKHGKVSDFYNDWQFFCLIGKYENVSRNLSLNRIYYNRSCERKDSDDIDELGVVAVFVKDGSCKFSQLSNRKKLVVEENSVICFRSSDDPAFETKSDIIRFYAK